MNKELIIRMAREVGGLPDPMVFICAYERFFQLATEWEREQCAKVCDALHYEVDAYGAQCAAAIRARSKE